MLIGLVEIARELSKCWGGRRVTGWSVARWAVLSEDPLPIVEGTRRGRQVATAVEGEIRAWAERVLAGRAAVLEQAGEQGPREGKALVVEALRRGRQRRRGGGGGEGAEAGRAGEEGGGAGAGAVELVEGMKEAASVLAAVWGCEVSVEAVRGFVSRGRDPLVPRSEGLRKQWEKAEVVRWAMRNRRGYVTRTGGKGPIKLFDQVGKVG